MKRKIAAFLCVVMCLTSLIVPTYAVGERDISEHEACAVILKQLGLFKGVSETDFDLERAPTRIEALVMLIRVLGKEEEALDGTWRHPFTDVPAWADPYVGYAYVNGLTNGISPTEFGGGDASAANYLTFMLRALGYSDVNSLDFTWDNPFALAENVGILVDSIDVDNFWRADVAGVSYLALLAKLKDSPNTLADKLIEAGAFTLEEYGAAMNFDPTGAGVPTEPDEPDEPAEIPTPETPPTTDVPVTPPPAASDKLNAEQISEKCASAVFYVEVYGYNGALRASGSGFFISADGYAITNRHVVLGSSYLVITTTDGKKYDDVKVVDVDEKNDLVLLKIKSNNKFSYLEIGDSDTVKQGQTIYAIGSPRGLENTLSQGLVSNAKRTLGDVTYIQISAQVDSGSSGGALINEYGKVVGVTTAVVKDNTADLNLAVPINKTSGLNKNSTEKHRLWPDTVYDDATDMFDGMYEFGSFTGFKVTEMKIKGAGLEAKYDVTDAVPSAKNPDPVKTSLEVYKEAMMSSGYTATRVDNYTTKFEKDTAIITLSLDKATEDFVLFVLEVKVEYYEKSPKVPDFGWYLDFNETKAEYTHKNGIHTYKYKTSATLALVMYCGLLEEVGFTYSGEAQMADGKTADSYVGHGLRVNCYADGEYVIIEISTATVTPQISPSTRLVENLKVKGTHDTKNGTYKYSKKISKVLYDITYFEKTGTVHFSSVETVSLKNLDLTGVDINVNTNGTPLNNATVDATLETYIYLNQDGSSSVVLICKIGNREFQYEADIVRSQFSENTVLRQKKYIGPVEMRDMLQKKATSQASRTLKGCGAHLLKDLGITLPDLGFKNFANLT